MGSSQVSEREQLLNQELERYLALFIEHDQPEQIIVSGSLATGDVRPWSDIDLVIIKQIDLPFIQRLHVALLRAPENSPAIRRWDNQCASNQVP